MRFLPLLRFLPLAVLAVISFVTLSPNAHADTLDHNAFACGYDIDLKACDEMVAQTNDGDQSLKAGAYALRALARVKTADLAGARSDVSAAQKLDPRNEFLAKPQELLADLTEPQLDLKLICDLDQAPAEQRVDACTQLIGGKAGTTRQIAAYYARRAEAQIDLGAFASAQDDITTALRDNPRNAAFNAVAIELAYAKGDYGAALEATHKASAAGVTMEYALWEGQLAYLLGYHAVAIREFMDAIHVDYQSPLPGYWASLLRLEDHEDSTRDFHRIADDVGSRSYLGKIGLFLLGKMSPQALIEAADAFPASLREERLCMAYFNIGHQAWLAGDTTAAKQAFESALQTNQYRQIEYQTSKMLLQKLAQK